jgi:hypothetical protein
MIFLLLGILRNYDMLHLHTLTLHRCSCYILFKMILKLLSSLLVYLFKTSRNGSVGGLVFQDIRIIQMQ